MGNLTDHTAHVTGLKAVAPGGIAADALAGAAAQAFVLYLRFDIGLT